jgi:hypothetical protein
MRMTEIIQMPPVKKNININAMYKTALINIKSGQASRLVGLDIGAPNIIVRSPDMYQIYVFDQNKNPIFYAGMSKFHNGLKTGAVASSPEGRGQGYGWKIYNAMSQYLKVPLYSDSTQTDDSRIGIWQQLIKNFPNRVVGYNQVGKQDVNTHDVYQNLPSKDLADIGDDTRRQTLLLKLLP